MTAQLNNVNYYIDSDQIKEFVDRGFDIYDDDGNKLDDPMKYATEKNIKIIPLFPTGGNS